MLVTGDPTRRLPAFPGGPVSPPVNTRGAAVFPGISGLATVSSPAEMCQSISSSGTAPRRGSAPRGNSIARTWHFRPWTSSSTIPHTRYSCSPPSAVYARIVSRGSSFSLSTNSAGNASSAAPQSTVTSHSTLVPRSRAGRYRSSRLLIFARTLKTPMRSPFCAANLMTPPSAL